MASTRQQIDLQMLRERVLAVAREILQELGNEHALRSLCCESHLERDLGLGSLERVELLVRLGAAFHLTLADATIVRKPILLRISLWRSATPYERNLPAILQRLRPRVHAAGQLAGAAPLTRSAEPACYPKACRGRKHCWTFFTIAPRRMRTARTFFFTMETLRSIPSASAICTPAGLRVAQALRARGIVAGDTVSLMLPTGLEFFFCFAGVLLAGAVPVPIYPPFRADRIEEYAARQSAILRNAGAKTPDHV